MVVHSHAVILMLLSLFPESFGIFIKIDRHARRPQIGATSNKSFLN